MTILLLVTATTDPVNFLFTQKFHIAKNFYMNVVNFRYHNKKATNK